MKLISEQLSDHCVQQPYSTAHFAGAAYNPKKVRGSYSRAAKNANPSFSVPESYKNTPVFIKDLVKLSYERDITISDVAMYARTTGERQKHFYPDRAMAMRALFSVFCQHINLVTHQIEISLRRASDLAGLTTISAAEEAKAEADPNYTAVVSISRASRAFKDMVLMGWILAPKGWQVWDKERGYWIDKYFEATPLFFNAIGVTEARVEKHRQARLKYIQKTAINNGMTAEKAGRITITQIKAENKIAWRRNVFDRRKTEQARKKEHRALHGKTRQEQRNVAQKNVIKALGPDIANVTPGELAELINKEIATLRKFAGIKPPLH